MNRFFNESQRAIKKSLEVYLRSKAVELSKINSWGRDACDRLGLFCLGGKMLRGGLTVLSARLFGSAVIEAAINAGAAIELLQAAFLIHDDIMDRDALRRGEPSLYYQYRNLGQKKDFQEALHFGSSMGICVGDISFFLVIEILSQLEVVPETCQKLTGLFAREITSTCTAQMQDIYWGYTAESENEKEILDLYIYKTGRYTFSLPLSVGAVLADQSEKTIGVLQEIGEHLGIVFQIRDDELSLYGTEAETGKPVGSDIKDGKTTLFKYTLYRKATVEQKKRLDTIFGGNILAASDLQCVRKLVETYGIREELQKISQRSAEQARSLVASLPGADNHYLEMMLALVEYLSTRTS